MEHAPGSHLPTPYSSFIKSTTSQNNMAGAAVPCNGGRKAPAARRSCQVSLTGRVLPSPERAPAQPTTTHPTVTQALGGGDSGRGRVDGSAFWAGCGTGQGGKGHGWGMAPLGGVHGGTLGALEDLGKARVLRRHQVRTQRLQEEEGGGGFSEKVPPGPPPGPRLLARRPLPARARACGDWERAVTSP